MQSKIIDGVAHANAMRAEFKSQVEALKAKGLQPGLAVVLVGNNPASQVYVRNKERSCIEAGMHSEVHRMAEDTSEEILLKFIRGLNENPKIHGILVQLPLPKHIKEEKVIELLDPNKDVDCFHPYNVGRVSIGDGVFYPCTPYAVVKLLQREGIDVAGKNAVIIGRSNIVGKPMALLLINQGATVTVCNSKTPDLASVTRQADILVVAVGKPEMVTGDMIKPGAVVIDVGINRLPDGKLVGDVDFASVSQKAGYITPVPGGVGPMTITMLLANTLASAEYSIKK